MKHIKRKSDEKQPVSGYCSLKMENITDIFSNSTVCVHCKKSGMKLFENALGLYLFCRLILVSCLTMF